MGAGCADTITYKATVDDAVDAGVDLTNSATLSSPDDPTPASIDEVVTVDTEADLVVTKVASADPATPGGPLTYTITVTNDGPSDARDVVIPDPAPADFTVTSAVSTVGTCTTAVSCDLGLLPAGSTATITIDGTVDAAATGSLTNTTDTPTSSTTLVNTADDTGSVTVALAPAADLTITKVANPTSVAAGGDQVVYTIAVSNAGPSDALDVEVGDTLPAGFIVDSVTPSQGSCASATTFPCDLGTVAADDPPATVIVAGSFPNTQAPGTTTNTAEVTSPTDPNAQVGSPKSADATVEVTRSADVSVQKSGPVEVVAGETRVEDAANPGTFTRGLEYQFAVTNDGPSLATGVTLSDVLDTTYVDISTIVSSRITVVPASAGSCTPSGATIDCSFGDVAVGELVTVIVNVDVLPDATPGADVLVNTATIASTSDDPNAANDTSTVLTDVFTEADVSIDKEGPVGQVRTGSAAPYTLTVTNEGPSVATNVVVVDDPPNNTTFGTVTSAPAGCTALPCTIPTLAVGETVVISFPVTLDPDANNIILRNDAEVSADQNDGDPSNNEDADFTSMIRRADMELVAKTDAPDPVVAGGTITYTVSARNNGPATARDATITDTVPANTTLVSTSLPAGCTTTGTAPGSTITCELGTLAPTQIASRSFDVVVDSDAVSPSTITNTASTGSDTDDDVTGNETDSASTAVGAEADVGIAKVADLSTAVPGESLTYTLTVTNAGPSTARDVEVADDVSAIFQPGSVTATPTGGPIGIICDGTVSCSTFDLPVGSFDIEITGTVLTSPTTDLSNTATVSTVTPQGADTLPDAATITTPVSPSADLRITKVGTPTQFVPGEAATYTITVTNDGPSDATSVVVVDSLPADFVPGPAPSGCTIVSRELSCTIASIAPGAGNAVDIVVTGTVSDRAVGTVENTAAIDSSATPDPDPSNDSATTSNDVLPEADLEITKTTVTSPIVAGETVRWQLTVVNDGPAAAAGVDVTDTLPSTVSYVNASTPVGTCTHDGSATGGTLTCALGSIPDQTTITIDVDVLLASDAASTPTLANTATVSTTTVDTDASNDSSSTSDPITGVADLRIDKQLIPGDPANPDLTAGEPYEYQIIVTNDGPSDALETITIVDQLPSQIDPATADVTLSNTTDCAYSETSPDRTVSCSFAADLAAGDSITVTVTGTIQSGATSVDDNTATFASVDDPTIAQSDPDPTNDSSTATATLVTNADLDLTKTFDAPATVVAGETIGFTLAAINNGPSDATTVVLTDTVPAGFTIDSFSNASGVSCTTSADTITCTAATVADGASVSVDVVMRAGPRVAAGPVNNTATISSATPDRNPDNNTAVDGVDVTRLGDLDITKTAAAPTVLAGGRLEYTVVVTSNGPSSAEATVLGDVLPSGVTIDETTIEIDGVAPVAPQSCAAPSNVLTCALGELDPGTSVTITYEVVYDPTLADGTTITNEARADSVTPLSDDPTGTADVDVTTAADLRVIDKTVTPDPVVAGETATYTITATNDGPSVAQNVVLRDDLADELAVVESTLPAGCSRLTGGIVSCGLGEVAVGQPISITFDVVVDPAFTGTVTNDAVISSPDTTDPDPTNDDDSVDLVVSAVADVTITKSATPDPAVPGETITYTLTVTNDGPSDALDVVVTDTTLSDLVPGTITASASSGTCDTSVSCSLGRVEPGAANEVVITITGTVAASTTASIVNTANVATSTDQGADAAANSATITTPVAATADLSITKVLDTDPPVPGEQVRYTITVTNPGPSDAQNVVVTDSIDPAVTSFAADQGVCAFVDQNLTCTVGTLAPGTFNVVVTGDLAEGFTGTLSNTASVTTSTDQGGDTGPNSATVDAIAAPDADLRITKTAAPDPVVAGETLTYTLTVVNDGPSTALDVIVDDLLPNGLTVVDVSSSVNDCTGLPCELGDLLDGASETVTIVTEVDADVTDLDPNNASVTSSTPDSDPGDNSDVADPDVTASADLVTVKTLDSSPAVPGTRVTWTIEVGNNGPSDATDVVVADTVPAVLTGVNVTSSQGACTAFPCDLGTIAPGGAATVTVSGDLPADTPVGTLTNTATTTSATPDPTTDGDQPTASDPISPSADVRVEKIGPATDLVPGQPATWTVTVTNDGPSDAQDVTLSDTLPAAIDATTIGTVTTAGSLGCSVGTPTASDVSCTVATLAAGDSSTVEVTGTVLAAVTDADVDNTATVSTTTPDPDTSNDSSTSTTDVTASADLSVTKALTTGFGPSIDPGAAVSWTITVTNIGPSDAQDVVVTDTLPTEVTLTDITSAAAGAVCTAGSVSCTIPTLPAGDSAEVVVTGTVDARAVDSITNAASVSSATDDPDPSDDDTTVDTPITPFVDLSITKALSTSPIVAGTQDRYTIVVTNDGPATAAGVTVTDVLPAEFSFVSASSPIGSCTHDGSATGGTVTCSLGDLNDQASVSITIDVDVAADAIGSISNTAAVTSSTVDPDPFDDAATATDPVTSTPDLAVLKRLVQAGGLVAGNPFTYEITVTNNGPSDALQPISVTDVLPTQLEGPFTVSPSGQCSVTTGTLSCSLTGPLAVGDDVTVTISGTVASGAGSVDDNTATVATTGGETDPDTSDNSSTASADLTTDADLQVTKTFAEATVQAGGTVDVELVVTNAGPSDAVDAELFDDLPAGFTVASAGDVMAPTGVVCTRPNGGTDLDCGLGTIIAGDSVTVTVTLTVDPSQPGGPVTNTASASSTTPDRNPTNEVSDQVTVTRFADLDLAKTVTSPTPPADVLAGDRISYQIEFSNAGPSSAEASVVGDPLPDGVTIDPGS
ncbi:MAG: hypothetical protein AAGG08_01065, partial [Actinomycetota bacterium]